MGIRSGVRWVAAGAAGLLGFAALGSAPALAAPIVSPAPTTTTPRSMPSGTHTAITVKSIIGPVSMLVGGTSYERVVPGTELYTGDSISTELNAKATLQLPSGQITLYSASEMRVDQIIASPGNSRVSALLRAGEAQVETPDANTEQTDVGISTPALARADVRDGTSVVSVAGTGATTVIVMRNRAFVRGVTDAEQRAITVGHMTTTDLHGHTGRAVPIRVADIAPQLLGLQGVTARDAERSGFGSSAPQIVLLLVGWVFAIAAIRVVGILLWRRRRVR